MFIHLPAMPDASLRPLARNIVAGLEQANPGRLVISTSGMPAVGPDGQTTAVGALLHGVAQSGISHAVIEPRLFLENLLMPPLVEGVMRDSILRYPIRVDLAVSWASHLDIAAAVAALMLDRSDVSGTVGVGHVPGITGADLAAGFSASGQEITFESVEPAAFGQNLAGAIGLERPPRTL